MLSTCPPFTLFMLTDLTAYRSSGRLCGSIRHLHPTESRAAAESDSWLAWHIDGPGIWFILWIDNTGRKDTHAGDTRVPIISDNTAQLVLPSFVLFFVLCKLIPSHCIESLLQSPDCP